MLHTSKSHYKKSYYMSLKKEYDLNQKLLAIQSPIDGPIQGSPCTPVEEKELDANDIRAFVKEALSSRNPTNQQLNNVICSLGLDTPLQMGVEKRQRALTVGLQLMMAYHFRGYSPAERADLVGELLFNGMLFGKEEGDDVAKKVTRCVTSCIFSSIALLRSIDCHGGALNDTACDQYAKIESESGLTNAGAGAGMLHKRWKITEVRVIVNDFADCMFDVKHVPVLNTETLLRWTLRDPFSSSLRLQG